MRTNSRCRAAAFISAGALFFGGCGGGAPVETGVPALTPPESSQDAHSDSAQQGFPAALPADALQPWETLSAEGYAVAPERGASYITAGSQFVPGVERALESATGVSDNGEAARFVSGAPGAGALSWAWYRLLMEGEQPGAVSADVNLLAMDDGSPSAYYIGLSDYGRGVWQWQGPFGDHHVRLSLPAGAYVSGLGNLFICVVAYDGAKFDVVGVAANPCDAADTTAPPAPTGLTATGIAGGLDLTWDEVDAADLAGYRVYYARLWFHSGASPGARMVGHLEGVARHVLPAGAKTYARVSAVDVSGNESPLSDIVSAFPLSGAAPDVRLSVAQPSGLLHDQIALSATGADSYDWDLDGDGVFDVTGDTTGTQQVNTSRAGVIRPALRGLTGGGECVGCGGVSVIVGTNIPPTAALTIGPGEERGNPPHTVHFDASGSSDTDGSILEYLWDFDGDGDYDEWSASATISHTYTLGGAYTAEVRVEDDGYGRDSATVPIGVNFAPVADLDADVTSGDAPLAVNFDAGGSSDADGTIDDYEWDLDGNGLFNETGDEADARGNDTASYEYSYAGKYDVQVRVTDNEGAPGTALLTVKATGWITVTVDSGGDVGWHPSLAVVDGYPAISYGDDTNGDLKYARAKTSTGSRASDWTQIIIVDSTGDVGEYTSLAVVDGCPAISYHDGTHQYLKYARATTSTGDSASDWTQIVTVDSDGMVGAYTSLAVVDGCPAISYLDGTNGDLKYARATTSTGESASHWTQIVTVDSADSVGYYTSLAVVDGCPAISYRDATNHALKYARATTSAGGSASDWTQIVTVDSSDWVGYHTSLAVVDGCPAISYRDDTNNDLKYARATTSTGESASHWTQIVTVASAGSVGYCTSLAVVDGRPAISYMDMGNVNAKYARASTSTGGSASDWTEFVTVDSAGGSWTSLAVVDGSPAISYLDDPNLDLKYAYYYQ
jgi:PKD repeat protein